MALTITNSSEVPEFIKCENKVVPDALLLSLADKLVSLHSVFYLWHLWNDNSIYWTAWPVSLPDLLLVRHDEMAEKT